ncbi:MAG: GAF domain-containing protein, partial [Nitrospirae bacterium]|nr:GAF domain-containing protein [Nitrospirota bacterium]
MPSYNKEKSVIQKIFPGPMKTGDGFFVISNIRDNNEFDRGETELRLLQSITQAISEAEDFNSALNIVLQKVCETTGWVFGEIWEPSSDGSLLECSPVWYSSDEGLKRFRINSEKFTFPPGVGLPGRVWTSKAPAWIEDVTKDLNFPRAAIAMEAGIRAGVAIPILAGKEIVAVMDFFMFEPKTEDKRFIKLISSIAAQIGLVIKRRKTEDDLEARTDQLTVLTGAICFFLESGDWRGASSMILHSALGQTNSEYGFIGVVIKGPALRILAYQGINWDKEKNVELYQNVMCSFQDQGYIDFPSLDNLFGRVITERKVIISDDPGLDPRSGGRLPPGHPHLLSFLGVPIFKGQDLIGMIGVANRPGGYTGEEQSRIEILCHVTSILYDNYLRHQKEVAYEEERKRQEEAIHHLAYYDMLTNLPNRLSLHDDIDRAIS